MRRFLLRILPSMFQRRLLLLLAAATLVMLLLGWRVAQLTSGAMGREMRQRAEQSLMRAHLIPTVRGRILDREGRVLAADKPAYDLAVPYNVITGDWAYQQARLQAWRQNRQRWSEINEYDKQQLAAQMQGPFDEQLKQFWQTLAQAGQISITDLENRKAAVIGRVQQIAGSYWLREMARQDEPTSFPELARPVREQRMAHTLLTDIASDRLIELRRRLAQSGEDSSQTIWKTLSIEASRGRWNPLETLQLEVDRSTFPGPLADVQPAQVIVEGVGMNLLGMLRDVWKEDLDKSPFWRGDEQRLASADLNGYLEGDRVGSTGVERTMEVQLRGRRGVVTDLLETQQQRRTEPIAGQDVRLSIDVHLQARIQAVLDPNLGLTRVQPWQAREAPSDPLEPQPGDPLNAAVVVLDVRSGQVLAAVSTPALSQRQLREDPQSVWGDQINTPFINRVIGRTYQPGSTIKPLLLCAAMTDGKLGHHEEITCEGSLFPDQPDRYRCWVLKSYGQTHGPLAAPEAIARSCNVFFYTLGRRLGAERLCWWFDRFQLGRPTGCGLGDEVGGEIPDFRRAREANVPGFSQADAIFMGIGQGPIRWTPLQAANAFATIARGGIVVTPTFFVPGSPGAPTQQKVDLHLDRQAIAQVEDGLDQAVAQSYGSAHHLVLLDRQPIFDMPGVHIRGKSGTAQGVDLRIDSDQDDRITSKDQIVRRGDHAWFIGLISRSENGPVDFVMAVLIEYGGSGGAVAGPVANQVLRALRAEGYL